MKRITAFLLGFILCSAHAFSQSAKPVVDAELAFARTSRETNTKNAFLKNLNDNSILFSKGEPVDGITLWHTRPVDSTLLDWWPVSAEISSDGSLGYTTGPWKFYKKRGEAVPAGIGYYSTIWQKQRNGEWKILVDLGISLRETKELPNTIYYPNEGSKSARSRKTISEVEQAYNAQPETRAKSFDASALAAEFRVHRNGIEPMIKKEELTAFPSTGKTFEFTSLSTAKSSANDLAFAYGKVKITQDGQTAAANYLRVWRNFNGEWKIVLDVIAGG